MAANPALILGSASPRRVALLQQLGLDFTQVTATADEAPPDGREPAEYAVATALHKAESVMEIVRSNPPADVSVANSLVIGADTIVCVDEQILGKPEDGTHASEMLRLLSGRDHEVCTGVALLHSNGNRQTAWELTQVRMRELTDSAIRTYVDSGEPLDKAGAYAIQGLGARFVEHVSGCYYNVVGLPLARLCALLEDVGYHVGDR